MYYRVVSLKLYKIHEKISLSLMRNIVVNEVSFNEEVGTVGIVG
jgi:hypothetical protein